MERNSNLISTFKNYSGSTSKKVYLKCTKKIKQIYSLVNCFSKKSILDSKDFDAKTFWKHLKHFSVADINGIKYSVRNF